jgi:2-aminoadipate transaminase
MVHAARAADRVFLPCAQYGSSLAARKVTRFARRLGVAINPGAEWSTDQSYGKSRTRLCFANPSHEAIRAGVAARAEVCRREFGVPARIANVERRASG